MKSPFSYGFPTTFYLETPFEEIPPQVVASPVATTVPSESEEAAAQARMGTCHGFLMVKPAENVGFIRKTHGKTIGKSDENGTSFFF